MKSEAVRLLLKTRSLFSTTQELLPFFVFCSVFCLQFVLSKSTASRLTKHSAVTHPITEFAPGWCHGYLQGYGWATLQWPHLGHTHTVALCIATVAVQWPPANTCFAKSWCTATQPMSTTPLNTCLLTVLLITRGSHCHQSHSHQSQLCTSLALVVSLVRLKVEQH